MKTFNIDIWEAIKNYQDDDGNKFCDGRVYFGLAKENAKAPYCVLHVLDFGEDGNSKTLCGSSINTSDIQFNVYATNDMWLDELLYELNNIILKMTNLTEYRILNSIRTTTKTASSFSNEVGCGLSRITFKYERL